MIAVLGIYPDETLATQVKRKLEEQGLAAGSVSLHTRRDIGRVEQMLSAMTMIQAETRTGLIVGAVAGGLAGFLGGMAVYPMVGSMMMPALFGLFGLLPFAVLGGYLGSLYGNRGATHHKIQIKQRLQNDSAVLVIARTERADQQAVLQSMRAANGDHVSAHEVSSARIESILDPDA